MGRRVCQGLKAKERNEDAVCCQNSWYGMSAGRCFPIPVLDDESLGGEVLDGEFPARKSAQIKEKAVCAGN
jgi:hypothetical protein